MSEDQQIGSDINYDHIEPGKIPDDQITTELFISHCTKKLLPSGETNLQFYFVSQLNDKLKNVPGLSTFFFDEETRSNPFDVMNHFLDRSRNVVAICTPEYINKVMHQRGSRPKKELSAFETFEARSGKERIIPVLLDISRDEFQQQGGGIPLINSRNIIEIPSEYKDPERIADIIKNKAEEIIKFHNELLKQW